MDAVGCAEFFLEMERLVGAGLVFVSDHIVRTADHAPSAAGAQPAGDDLVVEFLPLVGPAFLLRRGSGVGDGHEGNLAADRAEEEMGGLHEVPFVGRADVRAGRMVLPTSPTW